MHRAIDHPLVEQKMTLLRDKNTGTKDFRDLASEITMLICYEALKTIELEEDLRETPLAPFKGKKLKGDVIIVPILRAGVGMLEGVLKLVPQARVGFVGMYRDPETAKPVTYYEKFPENCSDPFVFVIDPMLATGGSLIGTIDLLKEKGMKHIVAVSIISAPEGIAAVEAAHPDVEIYTGAIDDYLNDHKYIVPGLGDAGDRLFGTK